MSKKSKEIDKLVQNINPRVRVPKGFGLWPENWTIAWLKQNQKKPKKKGAK